MARSFLSYLTLTAGVSLLATATAAAEPKSTPAKRDDQPVREIFVPFADLHVVLGADAQRVFMTRGEFEELDAKARAASRPPGPKQPAAILSAEYTATMEEGHARFLGTLVVTAPDDQVSAIDLGMSGVAIRAAVLDGKAAPLARNPEGAPILFVTGAGRHELKLEILAPVETASAQRTLSFEIPTPPASRLRLSAPGQVEIKSGATVIRRSVDETRQVTEFDLLPRRGQNSVVLSLNHRQLQQERVVVAHAVLIDEITAAYEQLHATMSMAVLHGAADQFRFTAPAGFEITGVTAPEISRWAVEQTSDGPVIDVRLREPATDVVSLNISAIRAPAALEAWRAPKLLARDVAGQATVVGLFLENRLKPTELRATDLISIDAGALAQTMPVEFLQGQPGAASLTPIAAFYAPRAEYALQARFLAPPAELRVLTNVLLTLSDKSLDLRGGFVVSNATDKLFGFDFTAPAGWQVTEVTPEGGAAAPLEIYPAADGATRVHVGLPEAAPLGESRTIYFRATATPEGWLDGWQTKAIDFPVFQVAGAARDIGAIAVESRDDIAPRADQVDRLTPLDANEKPKFGLADVTTDLAYRYEAPGYALKLTLARATPRLTARTLSFLRVQPDLLVAHSEIFYQVAQARASRLAFTLPASTPAEIGIRGLDGVAIKESTSEVISELRRWSVELAEPRRGVVKLAIDFQQPHGGGQDTGAPIDVTLPLARAVDVSHQLGAVAVEGSAEQDVRLSTTLRKVDIGELAEAEYQPGQRLLGAFAYGESGDVKLTIARLTPYELPTAVIERAELLTVLSAGGHSQTAARFQMRAKAQLLEIELPAESKLWSVHLDGAPTLPERDGSRVLIDWPAGQEAARRELQLVYETPIDELDLVGGVRLSAPKLMLRGQKGATAEAPLANVSWHVATPSGFEITGSDGTVFPTGLVTRRSPAVVVAGKVSEFYTWGTREIVGDVSNLVPYGDYKAAAPAKTPAPVDGKVVEESNRPFGGRSDPESQPEPTAGANAPAAEQPASDSSKGESDGRLNELFVDPFSDGAALPQTAAAQPAQQPPAPAPAGGQQKQSGWAFEGRRSLPIALQIDNDMTRFESLGVAPQLDIRLVDRRRLNLLGWAIGVLVFLRGAWLISQPAGRRFRYLVIVLAAALAIPWALPWSQEIGPVADMAFFAACWLVVLYVAAWIARGIVNLGRKVAARFPKEHVATAALVLLALSSSRLAQAADPLPPITVPADAIIVPYDPEFENPLQRLDGAAEAFGAGKTRKIFVPYAKYLELTKATELDKHPSAAPAEYALAGATLSAKLAGEDSLLIEGFFDIDVYTDSPVSVALPLAGGVLSKATVSGPDGKSHGSLGIGPVKPRPKKKGQPNPASQKAAAARGAQPAAPEAQLLLLVSGRGRQRIELGLRFPIQKRGGWRIAGGRMPVAPAAALSLEVASAGSEVNFSSGAHRATFETKRDGERIETALAGDGDFRVEWRTKSAAAPVDQTLTARGAAQFDVEEDGLRLTWKSNLEFRRGQRDGFTFDVPAGYLVEKVTGVNVRGWRLTDGASGKKLEVTLLQAAQETEALTVQLSRRVAVGGQLAEFSVPFVNVEGAAQQSGEISVRRSPLLELRTESTSGVTRGDVGAHASERTVQSSESPLGASPYQTYRFATTPFEIKLSARPIAPKISAELQTVLKISERQRMLETRVRLKVEDRPIFRVRLAIPSDWRLDQVVAPREFEQAITTEGNERRLSLYFTSGRRGTFDIVLAGPLGEFGETTTLPLPQLRVIDVDELPGSIAQSGEIVVEADPSLNVRVEKLERCETERLASVQSWLAAPQREHARVALRYRAADYAGELAISPRKPLVHCDTITNISVTRHVVEETVLLDFTIEDAGIRELSFLLPESMADARISAPMLRLKTVEPLAADAAKRVRVRLELQDEVVGTLRVLVENDRLLSAAAYVAPIPQVETGETRHRYVTLESAGRGEIVVAETRGVDALSQEQAEWRMLTGVLGRGLTQAYLARRDAADPLLSLTSKDRAAVETAGARIGLAKATLMVDAHGAYRGEQLYRVDNRLEQYLEIELPEGARLWTAHVAGEPVKPGSGRSARLARIPLLKTAAGDADYAVTLKYGGDLAAVGALDQIDFPLIRAVNVNVELSQVELHLPSTHRWFNFSGDLRPVDEGDLAAGLLEYNTKRINLAVQSLRGEDKFAQARAIGNLMDLNKESQKLKESANSLNYNPKLAEQIGANDAIQRGLSRELESRDEGRKDLSIDNRRALRERFKSQSNSRSGEAVNQFGNNFDTDLDQVRTPSFAGDDIKLDSSASQEWFKKNKLGGEAAQQRGSGMGKASVASKPAEKRFSKLKGSLENLHDTAQKADGESQSQVEQLKRQVDLYESQLSRRGGRASADQSGEGGQGQGGAGRPNVTAGAATLGVQTEESRPAPAANESTPQRGRAFGREKGLASLDVNLELRGATYYFTTPRGDVALRARAVSASLLGRVVRLTALAVAVIALATIAKAIQRRRERPVVA